MLKIAIDTIGADGLSRQAKLDAGDLPLLDALSRRDGIRFTMPVEAHIQVRPAGDHIVVAGRIKTTVETACGRCLDPFETVLEIDFSATARTDAPVFPIGRGDSDAGTELEAEAMDFIPCTGNTLDLADEISQQIIMALPFAPLCRDACKGLCPHCGVNQNHASCTCPADSENSPFAALKTLRLPTDRK